MQRVFSLFDDDGTLIKSVKLKGTQLNEGWVVMYKEPLRKLVMECKEYSKVRVFVLLTSLQTFDSLVMISIAEIARKLQITYKTAWECIKWLENHEYIKRVERDGIQGFMLNPKVTTCGKKSLPEKNSVWGAFSIAPDIPDNVDVPDNVDPETGEILN